MAPRLKPEATRAFGATGRLRDQSDLWLLSESDLHFDLSMQVVDYGPQMWFLVKEGSDYYLTVRCQRSFVEYELLIKLNADEYREYHALGHVYIDYLAARINYWVGEYDKRNLHRQLGQRVHEAIMSWKAEQES